MSRNKPSAAGHLVTGRERVGQLVMGRPYERRGPAEPKRSTFAWPDPPAVPSVPRRAKEPYKRSKNVNRQKSNHRSIATAERRARIVRLYQAGQSRADIAAELGLSTASVTDHLRKAGLIKAVRQGVNTPELQAVVASLTRQGLTVPQIAAATHVAENTVCRVRALIGMQVRARSRNNVDEATARQLVDAYVAGATVNAIARDTGRAVSTVYRIIVKAGVKRPDDRPGHSGGGNRVEAYPPELVEGVRELYAQGLSQAEVAEQLGTTRKVVFKLMRLHGIEARPPAHIAREASA